MSSGINLPAVLLFIAIVNAFWYVVLRVWEKYDFKYSFEWLMILVVSKAIGRKSSRLNVADVLYNPVRLPDSACEGLKD